MGKEKEHHENTRTTDENIPASSENLFSFGEMRRK